MTATKSMQPTEIRLSKDRTLLALIYEDCALEVTAGTLWRHMRSADARAADLAGNRPSPPGDLQISDVNLIGLYGLNIAFSDGAARGIYPEKAMFRP
jgi:DUF971 family protein